MKQPEYIEGKAATENFEEGLKALFKVPKDKVAKVFEKKGNGKTSSRAQSVRKPNLSDKD